MDALLDNIWRKQRKKLTHPRGWPAQVFYSAVRPEDLITCTHHLQANAKVYQTFCAWHPDALAEASRCQTLADIIERLHSGVLLGLSLQYEIALAGFELRVDTQVDKFWVTELDVNIWFATHHIFDTDAAPRVRLRTLLEHLLTLRDLLGDPRTYLGWGRLGHPLDDEGDWIRLA